MTRPIAWRWLEWRSPTTELGGWLNRAYQQLELVSEQPALEAQVLASASLHQSRAWVIAHPEATLTPEQIKTLDEMLERLLCREPLAYILGKAEFYNLEFDITPAVLIPRPETELLVETALAWLRAHPSRRLAIDVGTGSGIIAVTLAKHIPDLRMVATDASDAALQVAHHNADRHNVNGRIRLVHTYLLEGVSGPLDLVCANLPYIPTAKLDQLDVARFEPRSALDGGPEGLSLIGELLAHLPNKLVPGGLALFEIEAGQEQSTTMLAQDAFPRAEVSVLPDLAGHPRLLRVAT